MLLKVTLLGLFPFIFGLPDDEQHTPPNYITPTFTNVTVFTPPANWPNKRTSYARTVVLRHDHSNSILTSFTISPPGDAYLPVFQSTDEGKTWNELSRISFSTQNYTGGQILQPFLYELPEKVGSYPAGTILASGNGIPGDRNSTNIELHASIDKG